MRSVQDLVERRKQSEASEEQLRHLFVDMPTIDQLHLDVVMRGPEDTPTAEIYVPQGSGPFPVYLHIHGGGWFTGSAKKERRFNMRIAQTGFVVVNIDYGLAPEYPFPRGLEDCIYAARWISQNIPAYKGDPTRLAIGGGSAGGNLAAVTALTLHGDDSGRFEMGLLSDVNVHFKAILLLWAVLDVHRWISEPRYYAGDVEIMLAAYLGPNFTGRVREPLVSPIETPHIAMMPPTYLSCGAQDALLGHSLAMTDALAMVDVPVTLSVVPGADHQFHSVPEFVPGATEENARIIGWLHSQVGR